MRHTTLGLSSILQTALHGSRASGGAGALGGAWPQTARSSESHPLPHGTLHFWVSIISLLTSDRSETAARETRERELQTERTPDSRASGVAAMGYEPRRYGAASVARALSTLRTTDWETLRPALSTEPLPTPLPPALPSTLTATVHCTVLAHSTYCAKRDSEGGDLSLAPHQKPFKQYFLKPYKHFKHRSVKYFVYILLQYHFRYPSLSIGLF